MAAGGVQITGLRETLIALERFGVEAEDLRDAFGAISRDVAADAAGIAPVHDGTLRDRITAVQGRNKAVVIASAVHAGVINYGWPARGITGTGFLTDPANDNTTEHVRQLEDNLDRLIRRYQLN